MCYLRRLAFELLMKWKIKKKFYRENHTKKTAGRRKNIDCIVLLNVLAKNIHSGMPTLPCSRIRQWIAYRSQGWFFLLWLHCVWLWAGPRQRDWEDTEGVSVWCSEDGPPDLVRVETYSILRWKISKNYHHSNIPEYKSWWWQNTR